MSAWDRILMTSVITTMVIGAAALTGLILALVDYFAGPIPMFIAGIVMLWLAFYFFVVTTP